MTENLKNYRKSSECFQAENNNFPTLKRQMLALRTRDTVNQLICPLPHCSESPLFILQKAVEHTDNKSNHFTPKKDNSNRKM